MEANMILNFLHLWSECWVHMCILQRVVVCIAENRTQGLVHGKQTFYQQIHTPSWDSVFWEKKKMVVLNIVGKPPQPLLFLMVQVNL